VLVCSHFFTFKTSNDLIRNSQKESMEYSTVHDGRILYNRFQVFLSAIVYTTDLFVSMGGSSCSLWRRVIVKVITLNK